MERSDVSSGGLTMKRTQGGSRYGEQASEKVGKALHEMKRGELKSGGSGKPVTNRKQAIAIGLSEAREAGGKVPRQTARSGREDRR
jgi:Family of unknown function (DUF6496)